MSRREPFFAGLVYNEEGRPAQATEVGGEPFYAIPDGDFLRHVEAIEIDRQVVARLKERLLAMKDVVVEGVMQMIGSNDPFTRAAIEMNLENMDRILELEPETVNVEDLRLWLWMIGFKVVVNVHGEVVRVELPGLE
ncbi:MAG TPA: hypothetical protein ENI37_09045 [Chloroflexi bacterium]|nr:hypothetical protein [Chloroflexota bacterium]